MGLLYSVFRSDRNWRGLNVKTPDTNLVPTESPDLNDIDFFTRQPTKRLGATKYNNRVVPSSSLFYSSASSTAERVEIPHKDSYNFGTEFSIEFGFNFSSPVTDGSGVSVPYTGTAIALCKDTAWNFTYSQTNFEGRWQAAFLDASTIYSVTTPTTLGFQPNRDYFLSLTRTDTTLSLYIDGGLVATAAAPASTAFLTNTYQIVAGCNQQAGVYSGVINARLGEVRIWNDNRTAAEVAAAANRELFNDTTFRDSSLIGYWPMNEGAGYISYDRSTTSVPAQNNGYLRPNAPSWMPGLMGGTNALLSNSTAGGDYSVQFDGQANFFMTVETLQESLLALRSSHTWSVQFRAQLNSTATGQYLASYGVPQSLYSTYGLDPEVLEISTVQSGTGVHLAARFGGWAGPGKTNATGLTVTAPLAIGVSTIYNVSATRLSSTVAFAVGTAGGDFTRASALFTWNPPQMGAQFPFIFGGRSGPLVSVSGAGGTNTPYDIRPLTGFSRYALDEVRFWRSSVVGIENLDSEIPDPRNRNELVGYFRFREGTGFTAFDSSVFGLTGLIEPRLTGPTYQIGVVTPIVGTQFYGITYYQRLNLETTPEARGNRYLIANNGNSLYQFQDGDWRMLKTGLTAGFKSSFDAHDNLLLWGNGIDRNLKFDGVRVENNGIPAPTASVTVISVATTGALAHGSGVIVGGASLQTAFATDRTEVFGFWDGRLMSFHSTPMTRNVAFYTPPTSLVRTSGPVLSTGLTQGGIPWLWRLYWLRTSSPTNRTLLRLWANTNEMPAALLDTPTYLEGLYLQIEQNAWSQSVGFTTRITAASTANYTPPGNIFPYRRYLDVTVASALSDATGVQYGTLILTSTTAMVAFTPAATLAAFSTTPYTYGFPVTSNTGLSGVYKWRYSFYNPRTGTESALSPLSSAFTSSPTATDMSAVYLTGIQTSTDPQVSARRIYRTAAAATIPEVNDAAVFFAGTVENNTSPFFTDDIPDSQLGQLNEDKRGVVPNAAFVRVFKDRAFYSGITATPNSVYFSEPAEPESVPEENFIDLDTGDGDIITGLAIRGDELIVFKRSSTWLVVGVDDIGGNIAVRKLESNIGCIAHHTIVPVENKLYWCSDRGVYSYDGAEFMYHSEALEPFFRFLNPDVIKNSVAVNRRLFNSYVLSLPDLNSTENNRTIVYDYVTGIWTQWSRKASHWVRALSQTGLDQVFYSDYRGFLYQIDQTQFNELGPATTFTDSVLIGSVVTAPTQYTFTATASLPTTGNGLKGAAIFFRRAGVDVGQDVIAENSQSGPTATVRLKDGIGAYQAGDTYHIAPIRAYYKTPFLDLEKPEEPKGFEFVHVDQAIGSTGTLTVVATFERTAQATKTATIPMNTITSRSHMRGRGYHVQLNLLEYTPNIPFSIRNISLEGQVDVIR